MSQRVIVLYSVENPWSQSNQVEQLEFEQVVIFFSRTNKGTIKELVNLASVFENVPSL